MKSFCQYLATLDRSATAQLHQIDRKKRYRAFFATTIVAGSQILVAISATANPLPTPGIPSPTLPTRTLLNGSFETPTVKTWVGAPSLSSTTGAASANVAGGNIREAYNEPGGNPIIWQSTEAETNRPIPETEGQCATIKPNGSRRNQYCYVNAIEVWRGTPGNGGQGSTSGAGVQFAELNGSDNAALYQDLCVLPSENIAWSLKHAARKLSSENPTNIMKVSITDPTSWPDGKTPPTAQTGAYYSPSLSVAYNDGWKTQTGNWTSTNTSPKLLRFAFAASQGSDGNTRVGNFLDDVNLSLPALVDFLPPDSNTNVNIATHTEGNTTNYYYLSMRINGATTAGNVTINLNGLNQNRSFSLGTVQKGTATVAGLNATIDGNLIRLNIPAGTYNPNLPGDYIHIPINFSDTRTNPNDNLRFTLESVNSGNLTIKSTQCATDRITVETRLIDDDYQKRVELPVARPVRIAVH